MHFITFFISSILMVSFVATMEIISLNLGVENNNYLDFDDDDVQVKTFSPNAYGSNILETVYASQTVGKSHRFYFMAGERKDGDQQLAQLVKHTGWKIETAANVNVTFPAKDKQNTHKLTYVMMTVYQESNDNRIHVYDGGIDQDKISIAIYANNTKYIHYNATFFGI